MRAYVPVFGIAKKSECPGSLAQVGEWLKPADCKSAAPRGYEGSNPSLCTSDLSEPIILSVGCVRRFGVVVVDDDQRSEDSIGDAGDFGNVCGKDAAAPQRHHACGQRAARGER